MSTEQQFEITRNELKQRLGDAIKAQNYSTAEHWLEKLKLLDEAECLLMAYAPEQVRA
jgi:hypothetical protein